MTSSCLGFMQTGEGKPDTRGVLGYAPGKKILWISIIKRINRFTLTRKLTTRWISRLKAYRKWKKGHLIPEDCRRRHKTTKSILEKSPNSSLFIIYYYSLPLHFGRRCSGTPSGNSTSLSPNSIILKITQATPIIT